MTRPALTLAGWANILSVQSPILEGFMYNSTLKTIFVLIWMAFNQAFKQFLQSLRWMVRGRAKWRFQLLLVIHQQQKTPHWRLQRLWRKFGLNLAGATLLLIPTALPGLSAPGGALIVVIDSTGTIQDNGLCSLPEAIINANNDDQSGSEDCPAGHGNDLIMLDVDVLLTSAHNNVYGATALPVITSNITIYTVEGGQYYIRRDASPIDRFRLIVVGQGGDLHLRNVELSRGKTADASEELGLSGGAILAVNANSLTLENVTIEQNWAHFGGGVAAVGTDVTISGSTFRDNWSGNRGAALWIKDGSKATIYNSKLTRNTGNRNAIALESDSDLVIHHSDIFANTGAGVSCKRSVLRMSDSMISSNIGGGLVMSACVADVENSHFDLNSSQVGGAGIWVWDGTLNLRGVSIERNYVNGKIGGMSAGDSTVSISHSTIIGNVANHIGGLGADHSEITITDSTISDNAALDGDGGGGYFEAGTVHISNSVISDNSARENGGGLYLGYQSTVTIARSIVTGNTAGRDGGGIATSWASLSLKHSTISGNRADWDGGGLLTQAETTIVNSTISDNIAQKEGGGIRSRYNTINIINSTITGNSAASGGGIADASNAITMERNLVAGNDATAEGKEITGSMHKAINRYNLWGHDGETNEEAFSFFPPDPTDITATSDGSHPTALVNIIDRNLAFNNTTIRAGAPPNQPILTHALLAGSPAIDAAPNEDCAAPPVVMADQRYMLRNVEGDGVPSDHECDIGAVEYQLNHPPITRIPVMWMPFVLR